MSEPNDLVARGSSIFRRLRSGEGRHAEPAGGTAKGDGPTGEERGGDAALGLAAEPGADGDAALGQIPPPAAGAALGDEAPGPLLGESGVAGEELLPGAADASEASASGDRNGAGPGPENVAQPDDEGTTSGEPPPAGWPPGTVRAANGGPPIGGRPTGEGPSVATKRTDAPPEPALDVGPALGSEEPAEVTGPASPAAGWAAEVESRRAGHAGGLDSGAVGDDDRTATGYTGEAGSNLIPGPPPGEDGPPAADGDSTAGGATLIDYTAPRHPAAASRSLPRRLAIANQKGGVGKTTTAVNLGAALAELDYRVLVVDLDPQGNATTGLGINGRNLDASIYDVILHDVPIEDVIEATTLRNLFVVPATIDLAGAEIELVPVFSRELRLRRALETIEGDFDFVLIDCPPSLGLLTVNGLAAAGEVVVPIQCEYYALEGLGQLLRNVGLVQSNLNHELEVSTIIMTMYDARTRLAEQVVDEVRQHFGDRVCRNVVPRTVRLSEAPSFGQPIIVFDSSSRGAIAYRELAKEVSGGAPQRIG